LITNLPIIIVEIVKAIPQIITGIVSALGKGVSQMADVGVNLVKGLWQGIQSLASWLWDKVSGWISSIWDGICDFFGIASPSKEMGWIGQMLVDGLAGSISDNGKEAVKAAEGMSPDITDVMHGLAEDMETALPTDFTVDSNVHGTVGGGLADTAKQGGLQLVLNISTFNNYTTDDIHQLTNEIMVTAGQFAKRKGVVFA
jgi:phage-related protein